MIPWRLARGMHSWSATPGKVTQQIALKILAVSAGEAHEHVYLQTGMSSGESAQENLDASATS
jgi:hypothetical protein